MSLYTVGGRMNGWMDEWMDGWMDEWMNGWMDEWTNGWMDQCTLGRDTLTDEQTVDEPSKRMTRREVQQSRCHGEGEIGWGVGWPLRGDVMCRLPSPRPCLLSHHHPAPKLLPSVSSAYSPRMTCHFLPVRLILAPAFKLGYNCTNRERLSWWTHEPIVTLPPTGTEKHWTEIALIDRLDRVQDGLINW